ncbi:ATP-binding cassette domain-containing protein [Haladaptatus sp. DYF46]|uniref:ATP-binding cassette domain-containing protein n=1 Tax=Haladaptatus sp. DYF46 TaxID=2886041 RepID=UPI001E45BB6D|nr:ATP-binding cassette domain-containing protein [Haladaptatus sp. DYF46]
MAADMPNLRVENLSKSYQEVVALEDVSFEVEQNSILGLVGDNGAGKSTLLKILNGYVQRDSGTLYLGGDNYSPDSPQDARNSGVAMTYEEFALVDGAAVWENFFMGREKTKEYGIIKTVDRNDMESNVQELLTEYGFDFDPNKKALELSGGQRRILVVSRAVESEPDLLLLDEPFRGLSERAINQLWKVLHEYSKTGSIIITSQWYSTIEGEVDDIMILRRGNMVGKFDNESIGRKKCDRLMMEGSV